MSMTTRDRGGVFRNRRFFERGVILLLLYALISQFHVLYFKSGLMSESTSTIDFDADDDAVSSVAKVTAVHPPGESESQDSLRQDDHIDFDADDEEVSSDAEVTVEGTKDVNVTATATIQTLNNTSNAEVTVEGTKDGNVTATATIQTLNNTVSLPAPTNSTGIQDPVNNTSAANFTRYDGVAIVTKILGPEYMPALKQWICLLGAGYNDVMKYDIIVFTTMPLEETQIMELQEVAKPAKITVAVEGLSLEEQLAKMPKEEYETLIARCGGNKTGTVKMTWKHHCTEEGSSNVSNLGYAWQAEFRSYHIWNHPALLKYKYMMWLDTDAKLTRPWDVDPMKTMVEKNLTVLYGGFPYGRVRFNERLQNKLLHSYNTSICKTKRTFRNRNIYALPCTEGVAFQQIAGYHHITNLAVFRKEIHQQFLKNFTGDYRFSRMNDDQMAVTIVGVMEQFLVNNRTSGQPKKFTVMHERANGIKLDISHHRMLDAVKSEWSPQKAQAVYKNEKDKWPGLEARCSAVF